MRNRRTCCRGTTSRFMVGWGAFGTPATTLKMEEHWNTFSCIQIRTDNTATIRPIFRDCAHSPIRIACRNSGMTLRIRCLCLSRYQILLQEIRRIYERRQFVECGMYMHYFTLYFGQLGIDQLRGPWSSWQTTTCPHSHVEKHRFDSLPALIITIYTFSQTLIYHPYPTTYMFTIPSSHHTIFIYHSLTS